MECRNNNETNKKFMGVFYKLIEYQRKGISKYDFSVELKFKSRK